ncbi:MAG: hypothetical protein DMD90_08200 [Candidatus Rokuibacteriota bacterium]|nr:MAG: hypothetical protein DMD90_08200 [Candidatus Rokubacteria bacterium]
MSFVDVLDRVLDKGIVIDGWMRFALMGIDLVTVEGHVVVASLETYTSPSLPPGRGIRAPPRGIDTRHAGCTNCSRAFRIGPTPRLPPSRPSNQPNEN